jgi:ParB family chromosome partitioning protein
MIENIIIKERIRKDISKISELAEDIRINGLLNPITVMALDGGAYQLLAGLRRLRAIESLGLAEIDVNIVFPADAEATLRIEISENEQREDFTYSEKMDYARLLEEIERIKALERKSIGGKGGISEDVDGRPHLEQGKSRDAVGAKIGMSGRQYERAKYIADKIPPEVIDQLDNGERSISGVYKDLKTKEKADASLPDDESADTDEYLPECEPEADTEPQATPTKKPAAEPAVFKSDTVSEEEILSRLSKKDRDTMRKLKEYNALPPEGKIAELERQLREMSVRAASAESDLANLKLDYGIKVDHKDSIIQSLKRQNTELKEAIEAAEARIAELERTGEQHNAEDVA